MEYCLFHRGIIKIILGLGRTVNSVVPEGMSLCHPYSAYNKFRSTSFKYDL